VAFATDPEDSKVALLIELNELRLVDGTDTQLTLDGGLERRSLVDGARELLECFHHALGVLHRPVQTQHAHILLSGSLLRLHLEER